MYEFKAYARRVFLMGYKDYICYTHGTGYPERLLCEPCNKLAIEVLKKSLAS